MERRLGHDMFESIKKQQQLKRPDHPASVTVRNVAKRLVRVLAEGHGGGAQSHLRNLDWEFIVVDSPEVNAFVCPGGKVVCYTGLLNRLKSKDELAAVLAHEIAHTVARHSAEKVTEVAGVTALRLLLSLALGMHIPMGWTTLLFTLPHSRRNEMEADLIGLELMSRACYEPEAMIKVFTMLDNLEKASGQRSLDIMRTHPVSSERVRVLQEQMPRVASMYELSGCSTKQDAFASQFR